MSMLITAFSKEESESIRQSICRSFGCEFQCANMTELSKPDESSEFTVFDRKYNGYETLRASKPIEFGEKLNFKCDILRRYDDEYAQSVIVLIQDIPCFDSWDYMVDSYHSLYFFHNENSISALYCQEGYQISKMYIFENLYCIDEELKTLLKSNRFPV